MLRVTFFLVLIAAKEQGDCFSFFFFARSNFFPPTDAAIKLNTAQYFTLDQNIKATLAPALIVSFTTHSKQSNTSFFFNDFFSAHKGLFFFFWSRFLQNDIGDGLRSGTKRWLRELLLWTFLQPDGDICGIVLRDKTAHFEGEGGLERWPFRGGWSAAHLCNNHIV